MEKIAINRKYEWLLWKLLTNGKTNRTIYRKYLNHSQTLELDISTSFNPVIKGLHYITTVPKELEFPLVHYPKVLYYNIPDQKTSGQQQLEDRLVGFIKKANEVKKANSAVRLIYVSLGTVTDQFKRRCTKFFQEITN